MPFVQAPRLLQIAPRFCGHPVSGVELRNYHLGARLARYMSVTHIGFSEADPRALPKGNDPQHRFEAVPRPSSYRVQDLLRGVVGPIPFSVLNYTRQEMKDTLARHLREERIDIVLLEGIHMGGYVPLLRRAANPPRAIVCDWHNIESEVLCRYAETAPTAARRLYAGLAGRSLREFERRFVNRCDMHVVVSSRDRDTLLGYGAKVPIVVIENGVSMEDFPADRGVATGPKGRFRAVFVGAMDYHANRDAAVFFSREVWPEIHRLLPDCVFTIVGRNPGEDLLQLAAMPGIEVTGTVPDVRPYYDEAFVAVVPLRVAGGTRLKILEAMAAGVPVMSTARGAEGLAVVPNVHYPTGDTPETMRDGVAELSRDRLKAERLARAARELVTRQYDWATLGDALAEQLLTLLDGAKTEPATFE